MRRSTESHQEAGKQDENNEVEEKTNEWGKEEEERDKVVV